MPIGRRYRLIHEEVGSESQARCLVRSINRRASDHIKENKPARYTVTETTDEDGNTVKKYTVWYWA